MNISDCCLIFFGALNERIYMMVCDGMDLQKECPVGGIWLSVSQ